MLPSIMFIGRLFIGVGMASVFVMATGCPRPPAPPVSSSADNSSIDPTALQPYWPYWPVKMRFHPLTRQALVGDTGKRIIEARLELIDAEGDTTKGTGLLLLKLNREGKQVAKWDENLSDRTTNATFYDQVTRTYLLRLEIADPSYLEGHVELHATLSLPTGRVLTATHELRK